MALYRFLFAPVLLAVAVVAGPRAGAERAPAPRVEAAAVAPAPAVNPVPASHRLPARADGRVPGASARR